MLSPQTLVSFGIAIAVLWFVARRLDVDPGGDLGADAAGESLAPGRGLRPLVRRLFRPRLALGPHARCGADSSEAQGFSIPATPGLAEIVVLAYFANSLVPAKLGDAYRAYLLKRDSGVPFSAGFGTILAERFVDAMMLVVVLAGSALVVFGTEMPSQARPALMLGALLIVVGVCGLAVLWLTRKRSRSLPARTRSGGLRAAARGDLRLAAAPGAGARHRAAALAQRRDARLVRGPLARRRHPADRRHPGRGHGRVADRHSLYPAGLGVVELGVGSVLVGVLGIDPVVAGSIILLDRVVAYWSLLVVGAVLYLRRTRREYRELASTVPPA